jgi:hypothetical protein
LGAPATLYFSDPLNNRLLKFIQQGAGVTFSYDSTVALQALDFPHQMVEVPGGNIFICGTGGYQVYDTVFGSKLRDCPSPGLPDPQALAVDTAGGVYLGSLLNNGALLRMGCLPPSLLSPGFHPPAGGDSFIYPSPVRGDQATLSCRLSQSGRIELKIWNEARELSGEVTASRDAGVQVVPFDASRLATGVYVFQVTLDYGLGRLEKLPPRKFAVIR